MDFSIFSGGQNRVILPIYQLLPLVYTPSILLVLLISSTHLQNIKQLLSIPLLLAVFFIPFGFTNGNRVLDLVIGVTNYNMFLRFLELFWVGPLVQHRPVYTTRDNLFVDFWSCLRTFPKPAKQDTADLKKGETKQYTKDKKWYHLVLYLVIHMALVDVIGSWVCTFTGHEAVSLVTERPVLFFWYFLGCNLLLNSAFNSAGYGLSLFYCIVYEGGSYSSEQWRPLMINPVFSQSLDDLWSRRWHQLFKSTWLAFPFRPVRILTLNFLTKRTKHAKNIAFLLASLSVFAASSLMHEYVIAANMGWHLYSSFFIGEQCKFFMIHGVGVLLEHLIQLEKFKVRALKHLWVVAFGYFTFYYIMNGFITWGFQQDIPLTFTKPSIIQFAQSHPPLMSYFGSHIN